MSVRVMSVREINQIKQNAKLLHGKQVVERAIEQIADKISVDYKMQNPILLVVLNGGLIFAGKLLPKLKFPMQIDYCHATRYQGEMSGDRLFWKAKPQMCLQNRHVILVDDILDEGHTLKAIIEDCKKRGAASVKTTVLIEKQHDRKAEQGMKADYCELTSPDDYIFGCGMDIGHYWRNTDSIYIHKDI